MKKVAIGLLIVAVVFAAVRFYKRMDTRAFERVARERVDRMLSCMATTSSADRQYAIAAWKTGGLPVISGKDDVDFRRFWEEGGMPATVSRYEIVSSAVFDSEDVLGRYAEVTCRVEGRTVAMVVHYREPILWSRTR